MSIYLTRQSRIIFQGFTGQHATFHAEEAIKIGTNVVGGVTPGKGGGTHLGLPVFNSVSEAVQATGADVSGIFAPPRFAADAIMEAIEADIRVIVVIADGIPVHDMVRIQRYRKGSDCLIIGPNTPGIITPGIGKVGIMPSHIYTPGRIGIVSRSGTLNYEAVAQMTELGLGQSSSIGIGGDPVNGTDFTTVLAAFEQDEETDAVVMIGEIGGPQEVDAARWAKEHMSKPVIGFVAGVSAPPGRRMGHAGAIISSHADTATAKMDAMRELGVHVVHCPSDIGAKVAKVLARQTASATV
ncbi:MAG: succinate--CoA ligase subunit alpha [Mariprofundaceae bacterium]